MRKLVDVSNQRMRDIIRCPRCGSKYSPKDWFGQYACESEGFNEVTFVCEHCYDLVHGICYKMNVYPPDVFMTPVRLSLKIMSVNEVNLLARCKMIKIYSFDHLKSLFKKED